MFNPGNGDLFLTVCLEVDEGEMLHEVKLISYPNASEMQRL